MGIDALRAFVFRLCRSACISQRFESHGFNGGVFAWNIAEFAFGAVFVTKNQPKIPPKFSKNRRRFVDFFCDFGLLQFAEIFQNFLMLTVENRHFFATFATFAIFHGLPNIFFKNHGKLH